MAEAPITIPLEQNFVQEITKNIDKYLPSLDANFETVKKILSKDQYQQVKEYHESKKSGFDDRALMRDILDSVKDVGSDKANEKYWKKYKKVIGKGFDKLLPFISENMRSISELLTEDQKAKVVEYKKQEKILNEQEQYYKLMNKTLAFKGEDKLERKVQSKKGIGLGKKANFEKLIPDISENLRLMEKFLTTEQKSRIQEYQQKEELKEKDKQITELLKKNSGPLQKIKDKLTKKFDLLFNKQRWFEKAGDAFKNLKNRAGGFLMEILKAGLLYIVFKDEFDEIIKYIKPELIRIWDEVVAKTKALVELMVNWILSAIESRWPNLAKFGGFDAETRKRQEAEEKNAKELYLQLYKLEIDRLKAATKSGDEQALAITKTPKGTKDYIDKQVEERMFNYQQDGKYRVPEKALKEELKSIKEEYNYLKDLKSDNKQNTEAVVTAYNTGTGEIVKAIKESQPEIILSKNTDKNNYNPLARSWGTLT